VSPKLLVALAAHPPGVPWYGFARVSEELTDPGFCSQLRQAGCVMLKLGIESGDQGVLDALNKGEHSIMAAIEIRNLSYTYPGGTKPSISEISLKVEKE
jgi:radical SAM superfamily enzyme YgiQ (UPF0313 family)